MMNDLKWICHICKKERPDAKISVFSKPINFPGGVVATQNIRYCNDRQQCIDGAQDFSFVKRKDDELK